MLYEEFFITAFDGDVMGLYDYLTEYENLDELNHLAHLISELDSDEIETDVYKRQAQRSARRPGIHRESSRHARRSR